MGKLGLLCRRLTAPKLPELDEIEGYGADGEEIVYRTLCEQFGCVIRNVIVPHKNLFLEKDFLVIEQGAPFVIEVKHWKGKILRDGNNFVQEKENGLRKTLKSPLGTTAQFLSKMKEYYGFQREICGMIVFSAPECELELPESADGIAMMKIDQMVAFIKKTARNERKIPSDLPDPSHFLRCTRFYSRESEFCKGLLEDCFFDCEASDHSIVRVDTTCIRYITVEHQPLRLRDKLLITFSNGATGVYYNTDTVFTVCVLDGSVRRIPLSRVTYVVF